MNKFIISVLAVLAIAVGGLYLKPKVAEVPKTEPKAEDLVGASTGPFHFNTEYFFNGISWGTTAAQSSSTPSALNSASSFFITGTSTQQSASSTIIGSLSQVYWQFASTTPIAGTACNIGAPATSTVSIFNTGSTTLNGFAIKYPTAPSGSVTPYCIQGYIIR